MLVPLQFDNQTLRVQLDDAGQPWFNANDVCEVLDMGNPSQAMKSHVDPDDLQKLEVTDSLGRNQLANHVNESGLYSLILGSNKPEAKRFKRWVTGEVLPSLRKTGTYSTQGAASPTDSRIEALKLMPLAARAVRSLGLFDKNTAAISANQAVYKITGTNVLNLLGHTHLEAERQDTQWFTPTDLGKRLGISAQQFNLRLAAFGLQQRRGSEWEVTDTGKAFAKLLDTGKKHSAGTPVVQVKWSPSVLAVINDAELQSGGELA